MIWSGTALASFPDSPEKQKEGLVFLVTWGGSNDIKNVIIAFPMHCMHMCSIAYIIAYNYAFCNLIQVLRSGECDMKSHSEHQTLSLARPERVLA